MTTTARMLWTGLFVVVALPLGLALWGFSVDDAWIVTRVVENGLATGTFSFNSRESPTDAVTALGFAQLLAALCALSPTTDAFAVARSLGASCMLGALVVAAWIALAPHDDQKPRAPTWQRLVAWMATVGLSPSVAAWAGAGLETPVISLLCTLGCALWESDARGHRGPRGLVGALLLGQALAFRPELAGFALAAAVQLERSRPQLLGSTRAARLPWALLVLPLPAILVTLLRISSFGTPLPLAFIAKEPDLAFGVRYALGSVLLGDPLALWGCLALAGTQRARKWLPAIGVHAVCVLLAGGDWMPLYRLWVPVLPWLVAVAVRDFRASRGTSVLLGVAALGSCLVLWGHGDSARQVVPRRARMVEELRPLLRESWVTAAVDVGWVGRASPHAVVDLAGVTDPRVAALPGGHTSKRIDPGFFAARGVDTWLIRATDRQYVPEAPLETIHCVYAVDHRLTRRAADLGFRGIAVIPLPGTGQQYVVARHAPRDQRATRAE